MRLRIGGNVARRRKALRHAAQVLRERSDVADVRINALTGSVTILFREDVRPTDIEEALAQTGLRGTQRRHWLPQHLQPAQVSDTATQLLDAATQLDASLSRAMERRIDLKGLVPLTFFALAMVKVATQGIGWKQLPAYQLLAYAYSTFKDLNVRR
jgi:hypothetical protein